MNDKPPRLPILGLPENEEEKNIKEQANSVLTQDDLLNEQLPDKIQVNHFTPYYQAINTILEVEEKGKPSLDQRTNHKPKQSPKN